MPHPHVTIRKPPLLPFVPFRATLATTPQPSRVSIAVPNTSERNTKPRDIFDSSIFCCQPSVNLKGGFPLGDEAVDLDTVVSLQHLLRVVDFGGNACSIPAERL